jgi:hypothetical protein
MDTLGTLDKVDFKIPAAHFALSTAIALQHDSNQSEPTFLSSNVLLDTNQLPRNTWFIGKPSFEYTRLSFSSRNIEQQPSSNPEQKPLYDAPLVHQ